MNYENLYTHAYMHAVYIYIHMNKSTNYIDTWKYSCTHDMYIDKNAVR